jgi:hypothetical protein
VERKVREKKIFSVSSQQISATTKSICSKSKLCMLQKDIYAADGAALRLCL